MSGGGGEYRGNAEPAAVAARFRSARRAVVLTHAKPDGDAVGSMLATIRMLAAIGVEAHGTIVGPVDVSLAPFLDAAPLRAPNGGSGPDADADLVVVVDTGSWSQLDAMAEWVRHRADRTVIIDHHRSGDPAMAALRLIDASCASTTQLLLRVVDALGIDLADGPRSGGIAEALFIGLATDTGWFRFSNADAAVFETAARLLRAGVERDRLHRQIEETARPQRLRLLARALASLEFVAAGRVAIMALSNADLEAAGGGAEDLSGIVNSPMAVGGVEVSVLATVPEPGVVKLSFRSKPPLRRGEPFVDVDRLAGRYGGGGHVHAAGAKMKGSLAEVLERIRSDLAAAAPVTTPA